MKLKFEMKPETLLRLLLMTASIILMIIGAVLLFKSLGWFGLLGLFLFLWGNNIALIIAQKREETRMVERARIENALSRMLDKIEALPGDRTP